MNLAKMFAEGRQRVIQKNSNVEALTIKSKIDKLETTDLLTLKGIGDNTVKILLENGIGSLKDLSKEKIKGIKLNPFSLKSIKEFLSNK